MQRTLSIPRADTFRESLPFIGLLFWPTRRREIPTRWLMNVGQVSLIRSRCVCFPKARAFASSDVGAYGTSASPTAGLRSLFVSVDISLEWEFFLKIEPVLKRHLLLAGKPKPSLSYNPLGGEFPTYELPRSITVHKISSIKGVASDTPFP